MKHEIPSGPSKPVSGSQLDVKRKTGLPQEISSHRPLVATSSRVGIALLLACLILFVGLFVSRRTRGSTPAESIVSADGTQTATVTRGDFVQILRLAGSTQAVRSRAIMVPMLAGAQLNSLLVTKLTPGGTRVKRGDVLVEFDRQFQTKDFLDKQAEYQKLVDQITGKEAAEAAARAKDETELKQAEDGLEKAELEMQKNEVISAIDAEKNQANLEECKANLKQLRETFDLKRSAARADIRILEIQRDRARATMIHAQNNAQKMVVRSPMNGVVVLNTIWKMGRMGEVQAGDEVRPGVPFLQVVDPSTMEVRARVNQEDVRRLKVGQRAQVRLDAYPNIAFSATLEELAPLGVQGQFSQKVHTFMAQFSIHTSDAKLMPDLSAAVDVELEKFSNVLLAPSDSILLENGRAAVLVKTTPNFERRAVKMGPRNETQTVIESGVRAGEVIKRNVSSAGDIPG